MVELVIVMVLIGVLSVTVIPHFFSASGYDQITQRDALIQLLRQAQLQSMNRSDECQIVHVTTTDAWIPDSLTNCSSVTQSEQLVSFDEWGRPSATSATQFSLSGESNVKVCIESEGYIHAC